MKTEFQTFLDEEVSKVKNMGVPIKAPLIERLLVRKVSAKRLRPNPEDEFCFPDIGPNMGIISDYVSKFKENIEKNLPLMDEPLFVQKIRPSGYMILNGHHRWAAAMRLGLRRVPINIVNAVLDGDIRLMLERATHEKRATLDLDEVVFVTDPKDEIEKRRGFIRSGLLKKKLRLGIPALFNNLKVRGYDIWVYSSNYYSIDDVKRLFKHYGVDVDGIITGIKKTTKDTTRRKKVKELIDNKYTTTLHIDRELLVMTYAGSSDFRETEIESTPETWSGTVIDSLDRMIADEKK